MQNLAPILHPKLRICKAQRYCTHTQSYRKPVSPRFLNQTNQVVIPTSTPHISHLLTLLLEISLPQVGLYLDCADDAQAQVPDLVLKPQAENAEMDLWTTQLGIWVADCHTFPDNGQTANGPQRSRSPFIDSLEDFKRFSSPFGQKSHLRITFRIHSRMRCRACNRL